MTSFVVTLCMLLTGCATNTRYTVSDQFEATFPHAVVAADHAIASAAGAEILAKGGNAVDAAVATSFTLSVVRPMSCGIGGGGFMVIKFHDDPKHGNLATALNYRETTPAAVHATFYEEQADKEASTVGGKAVAIPGSVRGLLTALDKYGTLNRAAVMAPAIRAANEGFIVDQYFVDGAKTRIKWFNADESRKTRFAFVWKRFLREGNAKVGDRIALPEQARGLELIARDGANAFYRGAIASAIVETIDRDGGVIKASDLADYKLREVQPLEYQAFRSSVVAMPPPSSGGVTTAQIFRLFDPLGAMPQPVERRTADGMGVEVSLAKIGCFWPVYPKDIITLVELMKHAFADRARWLSDPEFTAVPTAKLVSMGYLVPRMDSLASPHTLAPEQYGTMPPLPDDHGTSHFSVIDAHGNAVACTETINLTYGSKLAVEEFGFCLNNEMDDFTTKRGVANDFKLVQSDRNMPQPGKRPLSSMSPTIVLNQDGSVWITAGASGGPRIITGTLQAILNVLLKNNTAGEAVAAPRIHHQWQPDVLEYEKGALDEVMIAELRKKGHNVVPAKEDVGHVQLIRRSKDGKGWNAACDPRKGGRPAGF